MGIHTDGRVFIGINRNGMGVYSVLNYFDIKDIKDNICPSLKPYPSNLNLWRR